MSTNRKTAPTALDKIIGEELKRLNVKQESGLKDLPLFEFLTTASPHYRAPTHFEPLLPYFAAAEHKPMLFSYAAPPRHGKALADDTPMATTRGWLSADEIVVGDFVYGSDGKFTAVTGVFPQGEVDLFKVSFSDDSSLVVCGDHQWYVRQRYYDKWYTKTTNDLKGDLREADGRKKWRIPIVSPVEGLPEDLPIDPYLLGLWLGDGTTATGAVTTMDPEIRDYFDSVYPISRTSNNGSKASCYFSSTFRTALKAAGLLNNKHVPVVYKTSPIAARLALLQGLADTDGTVARNGSQQSVCTTLPRICADLRELVSSLGGTYTVVEKPTYAKLAYNVYFRLPSTMEGFRLDRKQSKLAPPSPRNTPRRFIDAVEPAGRGPARCFSVAAPDHLYCAGKDYVVTHNSTLANHYVALRMIRNPGIRVAYGSYSLDLSAGFFSEEVKDILTSNGVPIDRTHNKKEEWQLENGSSFKAIAPGSGFTGRGADLVIIDDPYKSRQTAESGAVREETWNWVKDVVLTRRSPHASVIITHTRWNYEDVIGVLERDHGVPFINFPAINDQGEALWPSEWTTDRLLNEVRPIVGEYGWASLYMGSPLPRGGAVFTNAETYDKLPEKFKRVVIGIDCAYTKKTHSDYSAAVVMGVDEAGIHYIIDVIRKQCDSPEFGAILKALRQTYDGPPIYWYVGGQEKAIAEYLRNSCGVPVKDVPAREDKFVRAQAVAAAWNAKKILIPSSNKPWVQSFLSEVLSFSGLDDPHDDQVDALAAAFIPSAGKRVSRGMVKRRFF